MNNTTAHKQMKRKTQTDLKVEVKIAVNVFAVDHLFALPFINQFASGGLEIDVVAKVKRVVSSF